MHYNEYKKSKGFTEDFMKYVKAMPCATENEISGKEAKTLIDNGCILVSEGAKMSSTNEAEDFFREARILHASGKAANAGSVAVSGLEMTQNSMRLNWSPEEVDNKLQSIMCNIHEMCVKYGKETDDHVDYVKGAYYWFCKGCQCYDFAGVGVRIPGRNKGCFNSK